MIKILIKFKKLTNETKFQKFPDICNEQLEFDRSLLLTNPAFIPNVSKPSPTTACTVKPLLKSLVKPVRFQNVALAEVQGYSKNMSEKTL